jgi:hypothetical protein
MTSMTAVEIPQSLIDQQSSLNSTISTIETEIQKLTGQKLEAQASLSRIIRAIGYLKGEIIPLERPAGGVGTRKPMSEAGKAAIRAGLLASAARKREALAAVSAASQAPQIVPEQSAPVPAPVSLPE